MTRAFFPLTMPLTVGPGSIATAIALNANRTHKLSEFALSSIVSIAVSVLVAIVIWQVYSRSALLSRYLGSEGTKVAKRVGVPAAVHRRADHADRFSAFLQPIARPSKQAPRAAAHVLRGRRPYDLALTTTPSYDAATPHAFAARDTMRRSGGCAARIRPSAQLQWRAQWNT